MRRKPKKGEAPPPTTVEPSQVMSQEEAMRKPPQPAPPPRPMSKPAPRPPQPPHADRPQPGEPVRRPQPVDRQPLSLGKSVHIKGELNGDEDVALDGALEGKIVLTGNLTIGSNGRIHAEITAKSVTVLGSVVGNVHATDRIELKPGASVEGDLSAPRVVLGEGARFKGSVDMQSEPGGLATSAPAWSPTPQSAVTEPPQPLEMSEPGTEDIFGEDVDAVEHASAAAEPKGGKGPKKGLEDIFE